MEKKIVATTSLAGCFGCHMSFLDIDEKILDLIELVEFDKSPIDDVKTFSRTCDIGLVEGGCATSENVHVLKEFRKHCRILVAVGECAFMGGLPALRNNIPVGECLEEAYLRGITVQAHNPERIMPSDEELPVILDRVYPIQELVKVDFVLPGCPPTAELIWNALYALVTGEELEVPYAALRYD